MRKSVIIPIALHTLAGAATLLWLLWYFIPIESVFKSLTTLLIIFLASGLVWKNRQQLNRQTGDGVSTVELPLLNNQGPIVLVCGDKLDEMFQGQPLRKTAQGWWLRAGEVDRLAEVVRSIQAQFPLQTGQLSVMYVCQPDLYQDESALRLTLKTLRQQLNRLSKFTGFRLPLVVSCEFNGPEMPWVIVRGDEPVVYPTNEAPLALIDWQQTDENLITLPVLAQAFLFIRETLLHELEKTDRLNLAVHPFAVTLRLVTANPALPSVWSNWLYRRTCLRFPQTVEHSAPTSRFPDVILPLLAPFATPLQGGERTRWVVLLMWLCVLAALGFSMLNNRHLIRQVGTDLQRWSAIPMDNYAPKAQSLAALRQDALLLESWQRQGEPMRYSLGYFPGQRLWLALQHAIDSYTSPPSSKHNPVAKIVRLDSMSLFDSGQATLKESSNKVLVNVLVDIKVKPGWLIVVSGHTDNTGSAQLNQTLSLQRAEAVRDWMRYTGDVPESCFAVQGYGYNRPIASNDTPNGRAQNRRVEISLVPQADACRLPDTTPASPDESDALTQKMEK